MGPVVVLIMHLVFYFNQIIHFSLLSCIFSMRLIVVYVTMITHQLIFITPSCDLFISSFHCCITYHMPSDQNNCSIISFPTGLIVDSRAIIICNYCFVLTHICIHRCHITLTFQSPITNHADCMSTLCCFKFPRCDNIELKME